jgi:hypothetical protein
MHEGVKFKFISYFCVTALKLAYGNKVQKNHYKSVRNELQC